MSGTFAAFMAMTVFCASGEPVDGACDGAPMNKIEMRILAGDGLCPNWDCVDDVTVLIEIVRDGEILLTIPASKIDRDTISRLLNVFPKFPKPPPDQDAIRDEVREEFRKALEKTVPR